ncbi:MauE/DoxX family redox-associated membrane protein [Dyadobacter soli]|nr:MauE/DoxX family redox-associated membrane protein [Dyadobacter soli]
MNRSLIIRLITAALIILYFYTALSKVIDYEKFRAQMLNQTFPSWLSHLAFWLLPPAELLAVLLLVNPSMRHAGLWLSTLLMTAFTGYMGLVLLDFFSRRPCSCGGVISSLSFESHFLFNLFFLTLSITGLMLARREASSDNIKPDAGTGSKSAPRPPGAAENLKTE